jgi:sugar phosphate isomerase/epimerase
LGAVAAPLLAARAGGLKIGVMDTTLRRPRSPEAFAAAAAMGFEGVQVSVGRAEDGAPLPLSDAALQQRLAAASRQHRMPVNSTYLDILHVNCLKNDRAGLARSREGIAITKALGAPILMLVFFGKCALETAAERDAVAAPLKELAPEAARAGVILGFENLLTAGENARVLDRVGSPALKVYYDVGNAANLVGVDPAQEIRWMGRDRICQFHLKDKGYLGEGKVDLKAVLAAIADTGFEGYANLETPAPSGKVDEDLKRNLAYTRRMAEEVEQQRAR